ncbi:MAG: DUF72 domain-containing protein [Thermoproteota archaeon]|nr:DUF72 domain-containing protein [Thermoproteota archaeon]
MIEPKISIGTSGYTYSWIKAKPDAFEWYISQGFNSVEINYSFYRFPQITSIKFWQTKAPKDFTFSIKVHRSITHHNRLKKPRSIQLWDQFSKIFEPLESKIDFWLFQMPANFKFKPENLERVKSFFNSESIMDQIVSRKKAVIEFRDSSWWNESVLKEIGKAGIVFCSVDAPRLPNEIITISDAVYLRLHGTKTWYNYLYPEERLKEIVSDMITIGAQKKAIYLNNDHGMLTNGLFLMKSFF